MQQNILISLQPSELEAIIQQSVNKALAENPIQVQQSEFEDLATRKALKEKLNVSYVTLNDWEKKGYVKPLRIGRRVYFQKSEVLATLNRSQIKKGGAK